MPNDTSTGGACCFCGKPFSVAGRTSEHVMPQWILQMLGITKAESHVTTIKDSDAKLISRKTIPAYSRIYRKVCAECNSGWMSELECRTKAVLSRMVEEDEPELSVPDCFDLATWFYKLFALIQLTDTHERRSRIRSEDMHLLRKHGLPEGNSYLIIARSEIPNAGKLRVSLPRLRHGVPENGDLHQALSRSKCFIGMLQINDLLFTMVYAFPADDWLVEHVDGDPGELYLWPRLSMLRIKKASMPVIRMPEALRFQFLLNQQE